MINRREFLTGLAGVAAAPILGCQARPTPLDSRALASIAGGIVGASFKQGHLLRGDGLKARSPSVRQKIPVVILGGGVAGLSAAWKLVRSGVDDFHIFELEKVAGGNSRCQVYPESKAPWGAHYLPVPTRESRAVRELLTEMGVMEGEQADGTPRYREEDLCHEPLERIFAFGNWEEGLFPRFGATRDDLTQWQTFHHHIEEWRAWKDKAGRKAFAIPLELSSPDPEVLKLDTVSMADYMTSKGWTSPRVRYYAEYGCRDDYGTSLEGTSAWAGLHYFASRDGGGFAPKDSQFVWPEGNQHLVQHMLGVVGPQRLTTGFLVSKVEVEKSRVLIDVVNTETGQPVGLEARRCIYALPTFLRPYLLGEKPRPSFTYAPWVVANLVMDRLPQDLPGTRHKLCWDNVIYGSASLGYVMATHQDLRTRDHASVLTWYRPFTGADCKKEREGILNRPWDSWRDEILSELSPLHPGIEATVRRLDVMFLGHAMVRPVANFIWGEERQGANQARPPLFFGHSDLSGISIFEQAQYQGLRAAQRLLSDAGHIYQDSLQ